ncbi:uncharacterized protein JCM10292_006510 [Rhodotorula paludigena]|uniref:uncharacterized protein n=1 Tax=Rhodotorula paludigena TaxID=86838 RepID=UPI0031786AD6
MDAGDMSGGYVDAMPLIDAALAELAKGQLIRDERYTMMELMSAIEVNDARTDNFLHAQQDMDRYPPFDPDRVLDPQSVAWVHDEVVRLEATFYAGHPLASTLWTCNYLRADSLAAISGFASPPSTSANPLERLPEIQTVVLRALLLGVLKTSEIVWEEMSKNQVYEHEDVHLSLSTLSFNSLMAACFPPDSPPTPPAPSRLALPGQNAPPAPAPAEHTVTTTEVLAALDHALQWLQSEKAEQEGLDDASRQALIARVSMRIHLLYPIACLTFPRRTSPLEISHNLAILRTLFSRLPSPSSPLSILDDPPPSFRSAFAPSSTVPLLATQQPPRPVPALALAEAYDTLRQLCEDVEDLVRLWDAWNRGEGGWKALREWSTRRARKEMVPYVRSLQQSLIASPPHLFHTHALLSLPLSFLRTLTPLPASFYPALYALSAQETHPSQPAHRLLSFFDRLASHLLQTTAHLSAQNRARQRRWVVKSLQAWSELGTHEAEREVRPLIVNEVLPLLNLPQEEDEAAAEEAARLLPVALAAHTADLALEALLSGFEDAVALFVGADGEAREQAWYVGARIARQAQALWVTLAGSMKNGVEGEGGYPARKRDEAKMLARMCEMCWRLSLLSRRSAPPIKFSSPFLPELAVPLAEAERGRFLQRFAWLDRLLVSEDGVPTARAEDTGATWGEFQAARDQLKKAELDEAVNDVKAACDVAASALSNHKSDEDGGQGDEAASRWTKQALATAVQANTSFLATASARTDATAALANHAVAWPHPWFATWVEHT